MSCQGWQFWRIGDREGSVREAVVRVAVSTGPSAPISMMREGDTRRRNSRPGIRATSWIVVLAMKGNGVIACHQAAN